MPNIKTNSKNTDKAAEVAPYMIAKKENEQENTSKTGIIIPIALVLVLAVVIVSSFFKDEYKALIANLSARTEITTVSETSAANDAIQPDGVNTGKATEVTTTSSPTTTVDSTTASTQTVSQPGLITVYNPYLRPYLQVYAPIYQQAPPYGYLAPYGMPPQRQTMSYEEMMQRRQNMIEAMFRERSAAIQRMEKNHRDRQLMMEQRYAEAQKARVDMITRAQEAKALHKI